jgi:transmembrane sensor
MTPKPSTPNRAIPVEVQAEAAAWIARLHGTERTEDDDQSFRRWLAANPLHAEAFERMTELWETAARLKSNVLEHHHLSLSSFSVGEKRGGHGMRFVGLIGAIAVALTAAVIGAAVWLRDPALTTAIGERRNLTLDDGTRLTLNTSTHLKIHYSKAQRRVQLDTGEAFFEVAKNQNRPFIVTTDNGEITALGTAFAVRNDHQKTEVTLVEGRVFVIDLHPLAHKIDSSSERESKGAGSENSGKAASAPVSGNFSSEASSASEVFSLTPGERLTLAAAHPPTLDHPAVDKVTAWREGLIALESTRLQDAVEEMNRYSTVKLVIQQPSNTDIQVSGVFHAGDSQEFARALALSHGIQSKQVGNTIILSP